MTQASDEYLAGLLTRVDALDAELRRAGLAMGQAYGGALYPLDLLALAALNRSLALTSGFSAMIRARNFVCAAALLRLQLDTALRFAAAWMVSQPHDFAMSVIGGTSVRDLLDSDGKRMTDARLVSRLKEENPWIDDLYAQTSGYVHFSDKHLFNTVTSVGEDGAFTLKASSVDEAVQPHHYLEAVVAFEECVDLFMRYLEGWTLTKDAGSAQEAVRRIASGGPDA